MEPVRQLLQLPEQPEQNAGGERAENIEQDQAMHQRLFDRHRELIDQHCTLKNAHLSLAMAHQENIDREKINDQLKQFLEESKEIEEKKFVFLDDIEQTAQEQRRKELELNQREEALNNREITLNKLKNALDEREKEYNKVSIRHHGLVQKKEKELRQLEKSLILRENKRENDREDPYGSDKDVQGLSLDAKFASQVDQLRTGMAHLPSMDGFVFSVDPLFQLEPGIRWFLQSVHIMPRIRGRGRVRKHPSVHQPVPNIGGRNLNRDEPMEPSKQLLLQLPDQPEIKAGEESAENGEREPAIHQRLFDRHRELIDQDCALIKAHLAIEHQEDIDREKRNDQKRHTFLLMILSKLPKNSAEKSSS
uniref:Uncharacterized protein n=1 Tax=Daphnia galeata TaxID=27404 RepID=A0A8J2W3P2_9CRUS|nr:unnamed protein product [Daphnia galeata]